MVVDSLAPLGFTALRDDLSRLEAALKSSVEVSDPFLTDVATHLIAAGGKRLRPVLVLCAGYCLHGPDQPVDEPVIIGGIAVELVHLGSLYHDDVIDEALTRRGVETVNTRWSNTVAILAGDFLLAKASELAASLGVEVAGLLAATIGELCKGQVLELRHTFDIDRDEDAYFGAIVGKTASLISAACRIGAIVAGLDRTAVESLSTYGHHLGIVFQLVDDVLDLTADTATLGKPAGHDIAEGVYTLPVIRALRATGAGAAGAEELRSLLGGPIEPDALTRAREIVVASGCIEETMSLAIDHLDRAEAALTACPALDRRVVEGLERYSRSLLQRDR